jgi:hypothetical protein
VTRLQWLDYLTDEKMRLLNEMLKQCGKDPTTRDLAAARYSAVRPEIEQELLRYLA